MKHNAANDNETMDEITVQTHKAFPADRPDSVLGGFKGPTIIAVTQPVTTKINAQMMPLRPSLAFAVMLAIRVFCSTTLGIRAILLANQSNPKQQAAAMSVLARDSSMHEDIESSMLINTPKVTGKKSHEKNTHESHGILLASFKVESHPYNANPAMGSMKIRNAEANKMPAQRNRPCSATLFDQRRFSLSLRA
jgi:hypothetical protein